jgi:hypothetical protein
MIGDMLRNYLYLDTAVVDDYLSTIEGALYTEQIVERDEKNRILSGGADAKVVQGKVEKDTKESTEITRQAVLTDAAKFQRLYSHLEKDSQLPYFESIDEEYWNNLRRNAVFEAAVTISLPHLINIMNSASELGEWSAFVKEATGQQLLDATAQEAIQGFQLLAKKMGERGIPVVMTMVGSSDYKLIAYLNQTMLRIPLNRLIGEVSVLCKLQRKLAPGEQHNLVNLFEATNVLNQTQGRAAATAFQSPEDIVVAPAAVVVPIAIYR